MIISIVLFDDESLYRVARRATKFFSKYEGFRTTNDSIWVRGLCLSFSPGLVILNDYNSVLSKENMNECLNFILDGEEICISNMINRNIYINCVTEALDFDQIFAKTMV